MKEYIDKAALVAEIEKRKKELIEVSDDFTNRWACASLDDILSFIDTLEAKEVDLEKEIASQYESNYEDYLTYEEFADIAKHFFELGLKAQKGE